MNIMTAECETVSKFRSWERGLEFLPALVICS